jgi:hypothetical protein
MNAPLPWSFTITTTEPAVVGNVVAQGNGDTLGCGFQVLGQIGTTIGLGLLFDTLIVRHLASGCGGRAPATRPTHPDGACSASRVNEVRQTELSACLLLR